MKCVIEDSQGKKYFVWKDKEDNRWYRENVKGMGFDTFDDLLNYYTIS